jgi:phage terminase large subunit-like protein
VISAEAYTKHGFNSHGIVIDELHVQPNRELYDTLVTSTGARSQPMTFIITTAGVKDTFAESVHDYALKIQKGILKDETFLPVIFAADEEDDPFIEKTWKKANPGYGTIIKKDYFKMQSERAKNEPSFLNSFKRLHLNIWTGSTTAFIASHDWDKCNAYPVEIENYKGRECYGGLDLASVRDIAALVLNFPNDDGSNDFLCKFYCPEEMIAQKTKSENYNYANWARDGWITTTPGNAIDFGFIKKDIHDMGGEVVIKSIAYDRWNASQIVQELIMEGLTMSPFGQGFASMSTPTKALEKMVLQKKINHGGNPVLSWMLNNTQTLEDPAGNIKPAKNKSKGKIDGVIALVESIGEQITKQNDKPKRNKYNDPNSDLLVI